MIVEIKKKTFNPLPPLQKNPNMLTLPFTANVSFFICNLMMKFKKEATMNMKITLLKILKFKC